MLRVVLSITLAVLANIALAFEMSSYIDELRLKIDRQDLAMQKGWLGLLAYKPRKFSQGSYKSDVLSSTFFMAEDGAINPRSELLASLKALLLKDDLGNNHFRCRFPARSQWLVDVLAITGLPQISCDSYEQWRGKEKISSASLVYATGYMSNPASFFGHILLKFNSKRGGTDSGLLDKAINYGARAPTDENMAIYAFKGLFGFYESSYSQKEYYAYNHLYAEEDLRDIWLYELNLSEHELDRLLGIVWERMGQTYSYYYLRQNCAYRMAELLEVVRGKQLHYAYQPWVIPSDIFNHLDSQGLINSVRMEPSRLKRFYSKYNSLSLSQKELITTYIETNKLPEGLNAYQKAEIYETLFDYYEYSRIVKGEELPIKIKQKLLLARMRQNTNVVWPSIKAIAPHAGAKPGMIRVETVNNSSFGGSSEFTTRASYYDYLALSGARVPDSELIMGRLKVRVKNDEISLREIDIFSIETLNISNTQLKNDGGFGWHLGLGWKSFQNSCDDCLQLQFRGGLGKGVRLSESFSAFSFVYASVLENRIGSGHLTTEAKVGVAGDIFKYWNTYLSIGYEEVVENSSYSGHRVKWSNRLGSSRDWDVRINYEYDNTDTVSIGFSKYW